MKVYIVGFNNEIEGMWRARKNCDIVSDIQKADVIQFIGGPDVHPRLYKEQPLSSTSFSVQSDDRDLKAWNKSKPDQMKVGICRGGQFLNVVNGGAMWQHVDNHGTAHGHKITDCLFNREVMVSSTHHQMMIPGDKGEVLAFAEGIARGHRTGRIEGRSVTKYDTEVVWYENSNSLCFQPHPEFYTFTECREYFFDLVEFLYDDVA